MPMNRKVFFDAVRVEPFGGFLSGSQVAGLSNILEEAERRGIGDPRHLAYRLATVLHETGRTMQPIAEAGGESYLKSKPYYPWYGRGLVQCTWQSNYEKFGCAKAEDMLTWPFALRALFDGMDGGVFTGRKLSTYFNATMDDPVGARHIINGSDKAALIATYHNHFLAALKAAMAMAEPVVVAASPEPEPASPAPVPHPAPIVPPVTAPPHLLPPTAPAPGFWQRIVAIFTRKAA